MAEKKTWLDGPSIPGEYDSAEAVSRWPGELLGLPKSGPGAQASVMRRAGGVLIDWGISMVLAIIITQFTDALGAAATLGYGIWVILGIVCGWLFARTPGMSVLGMGVARVDAPGTRVGFWRAAVRTLLTAVFFPAAMVDADGRGMHDRGTGTTVIMA